MYRGSNIGAYQSGIVIIIANPSDGAPTLPHAKSARKPGPRARARVCPGQTTMVFALLIPPVSQTQGVNAFQLVPSQILALRLS